MQYISPARFKAEDDGIIVTFPDLEDTFTDGETMQEAFENAEDVLNLMLWNREEENAAIPPPSTPEKIPVPRGAVPAMIKADTLVYRKRHDQKTIRRRVTLRRWLDSIAREPQYQLFPTDAKRHSQRMRHQQIKNAVRGALTLRSTAFSAVSLFF